MLKWLIKNILGSLPYILLIGFIGTICSIGYHFYSIIPRHNIESTIGVLTKYDSGGANNGHYGVLKFKVNDSIFFSNAVTYDYVLGDKFVIDYEKNNPEINKVREDKPVFLNNEITGITICEIKRYNTFFFNELWFFYWVNGVKYERDYDAPINSDELYPNLKKGNLYKVKYWKENPQRSIILLNEPLDYISEWWKIGNLN